ncbi:MAG: HEAT repeat domain-containing protein [Planctomycetota bacterium]
MIRIPWVLALLLGTVAAGEGARAESAAKAAAVAAENADAHYRLALWCSENGLDAEARFHYRAVVLIDQDHRAARRALGFEQVRGRWVEGKDAMRAKGFQEFEGRWVTSEEYALFAKDEIAAKADREARKVADEALKRTWNADEAVRGRAMAEIERLDAKQRLRPLSIAARVDRKDVRMRAVAGLGALNDKEALPALYQRAIFDTDEEVRLAAVGAIKATDAEGKIGPFVKALGSAFTPVRINAATALGTLGDAGAIGPLVARYQVVGGSGQSVYISQVNQISYIQDFDVEVAQTAFIADPVIGVIQDGLTLNFRALSHTGSYDIYESRAYSGALRDLTDKDFGDDAKAWAEWYRNEKREERREKHG